MNKLVSFYRLLNVLSIDVALGAICCSAWLADFFQVYLRPSALLSLGLTVWIIYTVDHLLDAFTIKKPASTSRHRFHQRYFKFLFFAVIIVCTLDFALIFFIRKEVLFAGLGLSSVILIYLLLSRKLNFLKEIVVAALYCGGVMLPIFSLKGLFSIIDDGFIIISFFLTALINVIVFSWYDYTSDMQDGCNSFSTRFGKTFTQNFLIVLFSIQFVVIGTMIWGHHKFSPAIVLVIMNAVLFLLFVRQRPFLKHENYRLAGDCIFIFPAFLLLLKQFFG